MADKEALFIIVGVDEPTGDTLGPVAADLPGVGMEHIHPLDLYLYPVFFDIQNIDVRLPEDNKKVALAGILEIIGHMQIGVHASFKNWNSTECGERLSTVKGPATRTFLLSSQGLS